MCSDGLSNYIEDDTWVGQVLGEDGLEDVATTCIRHANESGGRDNITVIAIEVEEDDSTVEVVVQPLTLDQAVDQLSDSFLFRGLTFAQRLKLRSACRLQRLEEGEALVAAGETVDRLIYVVDGRLQLIRSSEPVCDLAPGQHTRASRRAIDGHRVGSDNRVDDPRGSLAKDVQPTPVARNAGLGAPRRRTRDPSERHERRRADLRRRPPLRRQESLHALCVHSMLSA